MLLKTNKDALGNYTIYNGKIIYLGNKFLDRVVDIKNKRYKLTSPKEELRNLVDDKHYYHLHNIDNAVFYASIEYFRNIGAVWCNLPLTTKMISSPGEIYAGQKLNYTTDTIPVTIDWFDSGKMFLAESSQFYLELRLIIDKINQVFSIYNSFRKEKIDFSHLAEFQHIEYEGEIDFEQNIKIFIGLLRYITDYISKNNRKDLIYYLTPQQIENIAQTFYNKNIHRIKFCEAMDILTEVLDAPKYKKYSLKYFGSYEEIALTRIFNKHCLVTDFPLEEIPFYHDIDLKYKDGRSYAKNADLILLGYREVIGSGQRITDYHTIMKKAKLFNLPLKDYQAYTELRKMSKYRPTCGFGMGWQRYTQWLLKMPYIWQMSHMPRGEDIPTI